MPFSKLLPLIMAEVRESGSRKFVVGLTPTPCDDGDEDAFLVGVAMSMGEVICIVKASLSMLSLLGVSGWLLENGELALE